MVQSVNMKKGHNSEKDKKEIRFLRIELILNKIYLHVPTKFLVETSGSFKSLSRTRCGRINGRSDKATTICSSLLLFIYYYYYYLVHLHCLLIIE